MTGGRGTCVTGLARPRRAAVEAMAAAERRGARFESPQVLGWDVV